MRHHYLVVYRSYQTNHKTQGPQWQFKNAVFLALRRVQDDKDVQEALNFARAHNKDIAANYQLVSMMLLGTYEESANE